MSGATATAEEGNSAIGPVSENRVHKAGSLSCVLYFVSMSWWYSSVFVLLYGAFKPEVIWMIRHAGDLPKTERVSSSPSIFVTNSMSDLRHLPAAQQITEEDDKMARMHKLCCAVVPIYRMVKLSHVTVHQLRK